MFSVQEKKKLDVLYIFCRGILNAIFNLVLYLLYEGLNISLIYDGTIPFQYLKAIVAMQDSTLTETGS